MLVFNLPGLYNKKNILKLLNGWQTNNKQSYKTLVPLFFSKNRTLIISIRFEMVILVPCINRRGAYVVYRYMIRRTDSTEQS